MCVTENQQLIGTKLHLKEVKLIENLPNYFMRMICCQLMQNYNCNSYNVL